MFSGSILIRLKDGQEINYANKYLTSKTTIVDSTGLHILTGEPTFCYYFTNVDPDTFEQQTGKGKIKGDYDYLVGQLSGSGYLKFPEADATNHADIDELIRHNNDMPKSVNAIWKKKIKIADIVSIDVITKFISSPYSDREGAERLPRNHPDFQGTNDYAKLREEHQKTEHPFIEKYLEPGDLGKIKVNPNRD
ncbi:MAG: hypothetical protein LBF97_02255 [Elusimicrobiota bacterium]|jgi:hypothetical protein|nr:hypothetical protein [Elusimicrobiota bacterium]